MVHFVKINMLFKKVQTVVSKRSNRNKVQFISEKHEMFNYLKCSQIPQLCIKANVAHYCLFFQDSKLIGYQYPRSHSRKTLFVTFEAPERMDFECLCNIT